ncbi:MAG: DUF1707 SHOCT-like domain-containing protein [Streptosporangiaceae bacterium]
MGNDKAARPPGRGRLRTSHADREQVVDVLKAAFVQDRLTKDEFDDRVGQALAARTYADLTALTADLPADPAPVAAAAPRHPAPSRPGNATVRKGARVIAVTTAITATAWAGALLTQAGPEAAGILWAVTFMWLGIVLMVGSVMIEARHKSGPAGELPPAAGPRGPHSAGGVAGVQT